MTTIAVTLRTLARTPVLVLVTVLSLGVGIGATTTVFSIVNAFAFSPASGLEDPESLVTVCAGRPDGTRQGPMSFPDYLEVGEAVPGVEEVVAFGFDAVSLGEGSDRTVELVQAVSGNFFPALGVRPALGRAFRAEETRVGGAERVVVISHDLWQTRFAGDPRVLGQALRLNGRPFTVVGVAPPGLRSRLMGLKPAAWIPIGTPGAGNRRTLDELEERGTRNYMVMARRGAGVTLEQVQAQLDVLAARLAREHPDTWHDNQGRPLQLTAVSERDSRVLPGARGLVTAVSSFLFVPSGLVLLIACANIGGLFLARAEGRRREMAIRVALGAPRRRLVALLLGESLTLGLLGGLVGVALSLVASRSLSSISLPLGIPTLHFDFTVDLRVLGFALLASILATALFGIAPALSGSRPVLADTLKTGGGAGLSRRSSRLRRALVVAQFACALVLIGGSSLFLRSLQGASDLDLGLSPDRVALVSKTLDRSVESRAARADAARTLLARLRGLPGVEDAQVAAGVELTLTGEMRGELEVLPDSGQPSSGPPALVDSNVVTPGYLELLRVPLLRGRTLRDTDVDGAPLVAVVNESFADRFFPGQDPLGHHFTVRPTAGSPRGADQLPHTFEVVGVTRDAPYWDIDEGPRPYFWLSLWQEPPPIMTVLVKGRQSAEAMVHLLSREVEIRDSELTLLAPTTLSSQLELQVLPMQVGASLLGWGGGFGLALALIGVYGVVSQAVTSRTREVAIRMAIGGERPAILRLFLRDGMVLALVGLGIGLALAAGLAHLVRSLLIGISPLDPLALGGSAALILLTALAASLVPASRASRLDPMEILREG